MTRTLIVALALLAPLAQAELSPVSVSPAGGFSASGKLDMKKGSIPVSCQASFDGQVSEAGVIRVTEVSFGGFNPLCKSIKALGLPWQGQVDNDQQLTVEDMQVKIRVPLLGGICGPGPVTLRWQNDGASAIFEQVSLGPDCFMDGTMLTTPAVDIKARQLQKETASGSTVTQGDS